MCSSASTPARPSSTRSPLPRQEDHGWTRRCRRTSRGCGRSSTRWRPRDAAAGRGPALNDWHTAPARLPRPAGYWSVTCPAWPCAGSRTCAPAKPRPTPETRQLLPQVPGPCRTPCAPSSSPMSRRRSCRCCAALMTIWPSRPAMPELLTKYPTPEKLRKAGQTRDTACSGRKPASSLKLRARNQDHRTPCDIRRSCTRDVAIGDLNPRRPPVKERQQVPQTGLLSLSVRSIEGSTLTGVLRPERAEGNETTRPDRSCPAPLRRPFRHAPRRQALRRAQIHPPDQGSAPGPAAPASGQCPLPGNRPPPHENLSLPLDE